MYTGATTLQPSDLHLFTSQSNDVTASTMTSTVRLYSDDVTRSNECASVFDISRIFLASVDPPTLHHHSFPFARPVVSLPPILFPHHLSSITPTEEFQFISQREDIVALIRALEDCIHPTADSSFSPYRGLLSLLFLPYTLPPPHRVISKSPRRV